MRVASDQAWLVARSATQPFEHPPAWAANVANLLRRHYVTPDHVKVIRMMRRGAVVLLNEAD